MTTVITITIVTGIIYFNKSIEISIKISYNINKIII